MSIRFDLPSPSTAAHRMRSAALVAMLGLAAVSAPQAAPVRAVQFFHTEASHYFMTTNPAEIEALDATLVLRNLPDYPSGWARTGLRFMVEDSPASGTVPVCRFVTFAFAGKVSHFFTASAEECAAVKASPDWIYEGVAFHAWPASPSGECAAGYAPIRRFYNNGRDGEISHAYSVDSRQIEDLLWSGFSAEGVAFCVPTSAAVAAEKTLMLASTRWSFASTLDYWSELQLVLAFGTTFDARGGFGPHYGPAAMPGAMLTATPLGQGTGWDPLANAYTFVYHHGGWAYNREYDIVQFDRADAASMPACYHYVVPLWTGPFRSLLRFQQQVWSKCHPDTMTRQ